MYLWSGPSGEVFAREFVSFKNRNKPGVMKQAVETLVRKLLSRLPYHSWVLGVGEKGRWVTVNSGLFHGLGKGFVLDLYSLSGIRRSPLTGEFVGAEEDKIGTLKIIEVDQLTASARIINLERGRGISGGEFFRFKPSKEILGSVRADKLAALEKQGSGPPKSSPKDKPVMPPKPLGEKFTGSKGSLSLYLGSAWSRYTLGSSSFTLDRKTSAFPRFKLGAEYWMGSWFGVGGNVSQGFIKFEKVDSVSVDETARVSSLALYLNFRVAGFGGVPGSGLIGRVGFHDFQVKFSNPDTQILTDTRYSGVLLGGEFRFPINPNLKMNLGLNYFPVVKVEENPVSSGQDQSSVGGEFYVGGKLRLGGRLWLTMRYEYSGFLTEFSGMGDRSGGITGAKTRDLLQSFLFGLSFEF